MRLGVLSRKGFLFGKEATRHKHPATVDSGRGADVHIAHDIANAGRLNSAQPMSSVFVRVNLWQFYAGILYLENHLISSLNDYCKRKETPESLKLVFWTVLDMSSLILDRAGGPGLTALHRVDQPRS